MNKSDGKYSNTKHKFFSSGYTSNNSVTKPLDDNCRNDSISRNTATGIPTSLDTIL